MNAAQHLCSLDASKSIVPFGDGTNHQFSHSDLQHLQDPSGISCEECDFLYGLVRILRPVNVLETGTNIGVSASAICLGLRDNGTGHLTTIEHDSTVAEVARRKLSGMGFSNVTVFNGRVSEYTPQGKLDFLWLDTELDQRFAELVRFYDDMNPGAIACIHDIWELDFDQFGKMPEELRLMIRCGDLRVITFKTPHGVTVFQKRRNKDRASDIISNQ